MISVSNILNESAARIKKIFWALGLHAFLLILILIFLDFILGGLVFYKYVFLAEMENPAAAGNIIKFNTKTYQEVLLQRQTLEGNSGIPSVTNQPKPSK